MRNMLRMSIIQQIKVLQAQATARRRWPRSSAAIARPPGSTCNRRTFPPPRRCSARNHRNSIVPKPLLMPAWWRVPITSTNNVTQRNGCLTGWARNFRTGRSRTGP